MKDHDKRLTSVLSILRDWDPIGVGPEFSDDEYRRYAIKIERMLDQGVDQYKLEQWLANVRTVTMGMSDPFAAEEIDRDTARRLIEVRD